MNKEELNHDEDFIPCTLEELMSCGTADIRTKPKIKGWWINNITINNNLKLYRYSSLIVPGDLLIEVDLWKEDKRICGVFLGGEDSGLLLSDNIPSEAF